MWTKCPMNFIIECLFDAKMICVHISFLRGQKAVLTHYDNFFDSIVLSVFILSVVVEDYMGKKLFDSLKK